MSRLKFILVFSGFLLTVLLAAVKLPPSAAIVSGQDAPSQVAAPSDPQSAQPPEMAAEQKKEVKTYSLPPDKYKQAVEYSRARYGLYFIDAIYGILVLLAVLRWRVAPGFRSWAEQTSLRRFVQVLMYAPFLLLTLGVMGLPTAVYGHWLSLKYQQSVQGWALWLWDWTKGQIIELIIGTFLVWILYGIIRRSPRRWWFYSWMASIPTIVFLLFIAPVVIEPLFFKFEPLQSKQPALASEISRVLRHAGLSIPPERMFEMKASEKLKSVDAYVTGIGASKRVVVWDTTISKMTIPQTLFVFGHEMGHYVLGHIRKMIAFTIGVLFIFLYLGFRGMRWAIRRWGPRWDIRGVDDWASFPVLLLFFVLFSFLASPAINSFSRYQEHEADIYGLEVIHGLVPDSPQVAAQAFQILGEVDLADPNPNSFIKFWLYSHPPLNERIAFARDYDPWSKGRQPEFVQWQ